MAGKTRALRDARWARRPWGGDDARGHHRGSLGRRATAGRGAERGQRGASAPVSRPGRGAAASPIERRITRRYAVIAGVQEMAVALPMPVLILHMTGRGLDLGLIGLAFTVRAVLVVLLEIPTGGLADAIGRKPVALASQVLTLGSFTALLFLTGPLTALLYAVLQGVGAALHSGALDAWYVDRLKRANSDVALQPHLAVIDVVQSAAMLAGTALGGFLPSWAAGLHLPWPLAGFGIALFAGVLLRGVAWLLTLALVQEPEFEGRGGVAGLRAMPEVLRDAVGLARRVRSVRYLLLAASAGGVAMISVETFWQPIAALSVGAAPSDSGAFGIFGTVMGAAALVGGLAVVRFGGTFPGGPAALAGVSLALRGVAMALLAALVTPTGLGASLALVYFALAAGNAPHAALLNDVVPNDRRSSMLSVNSLASFLGIALGAGALGALAQATSPRLALASAAAVSVVAATAYLRVGSLRRLDARSPARAAVTAALRPPEPEPAVAD